MATAVVLITEANVSSPPLLTEGGEIVLMYPTSVEHPVLMARRH